MKNDKQRRQNDVLANLKVALVYDRLNSYGGAERVLECWHQSFPHAPLYTSVYDPVSSPWLSGWNVRPSWLNKIPWLRRRHRWLGWLMPLVFETIDLSEFDVVLSLTSEAAKAVVTRPEQLHICYLLTPTRYLWSHAAEYEQKIPRWLRWLWIKLLPFYQRWDQVAAQHPDVIIPISLEVEGRVKKYYQRECDAPLYPPPASLPSSQEPQYKPTGPFFFSWGRLVPYKHFEVAIQAAVQNKQQLLIAGQGPASRNWQKLARRLDPQGEYICFLGRITDSDLAWYLEHAKAAIFPQPDDFGLAPLEATTLGCPVIVHADSGVTEVLAKNKNALLIKKTSVNSLARAMRQIDEISWSRLDIRAQASEYAKVDCPRQWRQVVRTYWHRHQQQRKGKS